MPDGSTLHCSKCNKYYLNNNGKVGDETSSPYKKRVLYIKNEQEILRELII